MEIRTVKPSDAQTRKIAIDTDTALAAQHEELAKLRQRQVGAYSSLHYALGDSRDRRGHWGMDNGDAYDKAVYQVENGEASSRVERALDNLIEIERDIDLAFERIAELDAIHNEYRWNRYFLVTNANGHVHRGMSCSTCFANTEYAWLIELADCDEDVMITEFGEKACTVCFPDAPANPKIKSPGRRDREAQAARQAEKDERANAKAAKRLLPGEVFRTSYNRDLVETVATCKDIIRQAVDCAEELKVISTTKFATTWTGDMEQLARFISNVTGILAQRQDDAKEATRVLLARERRHEGYGMTQAAIDKIIASKAKASAKAWAQA